MVKAYFHLKDGKEFFYLEKPSIADEKAAPFIFDDLAGERHRLEYAVEYKLFTDMREVEGEMAKAAAPSENIGKKLSSILGRVFRTIK